MQIIFLYQLIPMIYSFFLLTISLWFWLSHATNKGLHITADLCAPGERGYFSPLSELLQQTAEKKQARARPGP